MWYQGFIKSTLNRLKYGNPAGGNKVVQGTETMLFKLVHLYPRNEATSESQRNWDEIREFLDCNSHLSVDHSKPAPKVLLLFVIMRVRL